VANKFQSSELRNYLRISDGNDKKCQVKLLSGFQISKYDGNVKKVRFKVRRQVTQLLPSFDVHLEGRDGGDEEDGPEDGQGWGCPEVVLLLVAEHDERETECRDEKSRVKDVWGQFYQHAYAQLLRSQMRCISASNK